MDFSRILSNFAKLLPAVGGLVPFNPLTTMFLQYLKTLLQLVLNPRKAWADVAEDNPSAAAMTERGFYPLLAIMAATAFCHGFYNPDTFSVSSSLMDALAQFLSLFMTLLIARGALESLLPPMEADGAVYGRNALVPVFCTGLLALINIVANLCPIELAIFWFLPALLIILFWHTIDYLYIKPDSTGTYMSLTTLLLVVVPVLLNFILGLVL